MTDSLNRQKRKQMSETRFINKTLVICYFIAVFLGMAGYLTSLSSDPQPPLSIVIWIGSCIGPFILCAVAYLINKESKKIQYFMSFGYLFFYLISLFMEADDIFIYVYIFPVLITLIACNNIKLIYVIGAITIISNLVDTFLSWKIASESENLSRVAMVGICASFAILAARVTDKLTKQKLALIENKKNAAESMMSVINDESEKMSGAIGELNSNKEKLQESVDSTSSVVSGINSGIQEAVNSIQQQLSATENIQKLVEEVKGQVTGMSSLMAGTGDSVNKGTSKMTELSQSADTMKEKNKVILKEVGELEERAGEVRNIVEIINGVASQTRLLSLNASIEAARAGEHGRGFAVVAEEINHLSHQTEESINDITKIIDILNSEMRAVKEAVDDMMKANEIQNVAIENVAESFSSIRDSVGEVKDEMSQLSVHIVNVNNHTKSIMEDAANVSSVTEEVLASTNEADQICEKNKTIVKKINEIANSLQTGADNLMKNRI